MTYEPQGVFAEGRTFDFGQEEGIFTPQYAKSKRGPKPKGSRFSKCEGCGNSFTVTRGAVGKYCSKPCMHQSRIESRPVGFDCSRCIASVGIGMGVASRILGVTKASIHRSWRKLGIRAQLPKGVDSWMQYRVRAESSVCGWWGNAETGNAWMSEYTPRFPDWGSIWNIERSNRLSTKYYNSAESIYERVCYRDIISRGFKSTYPDWSSIWTNSRMSMSAEEKAVDNLRTRFKLLIKTAKSGGSFIRSNLIGCTTSQLKTHLESTFKRGMTWDNYGTRWHVDHILPCASFDHTDENQRAQCWHWTNLRALDAKKNMEKSDTITEPQMSLLLCVSR